MVEAELSATNVLLRLATSIVTVGHNPLSIPVAFDSRLSGSSVATYAVERSSTGLECCVFTSRAASATERTSFASSEGEGNDSAHRRRGQDSEGRAYR